jgi:hypothetical protein
LVEIRIRGRNASKIPRQAWGPFTSARRVMVGAKKTGIILADGFHADIVRVIRVEVNTKIHESMLRKWGFKIK